MSKEFTKSYAINRIAELNEQIVEMTDNQNQTMRYLNRIRDENNQLKQQLEEKDKEIERLKVFEKVYYQNQIQASQETINKLLQSAYQSPIAIGLNQIAITELEKVKVNLKDRISMMKNEEHSYLQKVVAWYDICDQINQQIKELKGE